MLLCGDMNVNSGDENNFIDNFKASFKSQNREMTETNRAHFRYAETEYNSMMSILSNLDKDRIVDCLRANIDRNEYRNTFADAEEKDGQTVPREVSLTVAEELGLKERLDYIFWLNPDDNCELQVQVEQTFVEPHFTPYDEKAECYHYPFSQVSDHYGVST